MKVFLVAILSLFFVLSGFSQKVKLAEDYSPVSLNLLEKTAAAKTSKYAKARVTLAEVNEIKNADALETANVPNYIKALAQNTKAAPQFANLVQAFLFGGSLAPETKMAIGVRIAQIYSSPYLFAHASRWLRATAKGQNLLKNWEDRKTFSEAEKQAIDYAEKLTNDIHGVSDEDFARTRGFYNDSQVIELTMTVCFFNHFVRFVEATNLPVEDWVLNDKAPKVADSI